MKTILNLFFLFSSLISLSQDFITPGFIFNPKDEPAPQLSSKITRSKSYENNFNQLFVPYKRFFKVQNNSVISVQLSFKSGLTLLVNKFSGDSLNSEKRNEIDFTIKNGAAYEGLEFFGKEIFIFMSEKVKGSDHLFVLKAYRIDQNDLTLQNPIELFKMSNPEKTYLIGGIKLTKLEFPRCSSFNISSDSSKLSILYRHKPKYKDNKKNKDILGLYTFNTNFDLLWGKNYEMPYTEFELDVLSVFVENNGTDYLIAKKYIDRYNASIGPENNKLIIFSINGQDEMKEYFIDLDGMVASTFQMVNYYDGRVACVGFYGIRNGIVKGAFLAKMNFNGEFESAILNEFSSEFIFSFDPVGLARHERNGDIVQMKKQTIRQLFVDSLNNVIIVSENFENVGENYYEFRNIVAFIINESGEIHWQYKIPRLSLMSSFQSFHDGENLYIFYDCDYRNQSLSSDKKPYYNGGENTYLTLTKINKNDGVKSNQLLYTMYNIDGLIIQSYNPNNICYLGHNTIAIEHSFKKDKGQMFKVEFEE